jgi:hypothetical protein
MNKVTKFYRLPKISPHPWRFVPKHNTIFDANDWGFITHGPIKETDGELDPELRIMSAAPELFEALSAFRDKFAIYQSLGILNCPDSRRLIKKAEAALSKAVGENENS